MILTVREREKHARFAWRSLGMAMVPGPPITHANSRRNSWMRRTGQDSTLISKVGSFLKNGLMAGVLKFRTHRVDRAADTKPGFTAESLSGPSWHLQGELTGEIPGVSVLNKPS